MVRRRRYPERVRQRLATTALAGAFLIAGAIAPSGAVAKAGTAFRPFVDFSGYPPPNLKMIKHGSHARQISLGFVTAQGGTDCTPTWGGYAQYQATGKKPYQAANVAAFRKAGGEPIASFGGQAGTELAATCGSVGDLEDAYGRTISAYGLKRVDFDIEGAAVADHDADVRRAAAVAGLQKAARKRGGAVAVSLTLPVNPSGLDADARGVVSDFKNAGVKVDLVNVMAMDYGKEVAPHPAGRMGDYAIAAGKHTVAQLKTLWPHMHQTSSHRWVGVTPMIGINDVSSEIFSVQDARGLAKFAKSFGLGELSMWQLARDAQCKHPSSTTQEICSGVKQRRHQFAKILGGV
jgi:hypothetical protein